MEGLSAVGSGPYSSTQQGKKLSKKGDGFKTYRPREYSATLSIHR